MTEREDSVTVLLCQRGKRATKLYRDPTREPEAFDAGTLFTVERETVGSLADLVALLDEVRRAPRAMIIRGEPHPDVELDSEQVRRLSIPRPDCDAAFISTARRWLMIDVDKSGVPFDSGDLLGSVERWRAALPNGLRDAEMAFQFSARQHLSPDVRGHAFLWLDEPTEDVRLRLWARINGFDGSLYDAVHPHFVADPIFVGCRDPLDRGLIWLDGYAPVLALPEVTPRDKPGRAAMRSRVAEEYGEPSPRLARPRGQIVKALGDPRALDGLRYSICYALGGMLAKNWVPLADTAAVVRQWLDVDDPRIDVENGVRGARAAYELDDPQMAIGYQEIAQLVGQETADAIGLVVGRMRASVLDRVRVTW